MRKNGIIPSILVCLFSVAQGLAQNGGRAFVHDSLDNYVNHALQDWHIPGLSLCIIKDGKVVVCKGYGVKRLGAQDMVDENTLFMIGSNSKAFTATALAMLAQEKKLSLDDKVTQWIPQFALNNRAAGEQAIIRDLLCHRIGFRTFQGDFTYWTSDLTRSQVIEKMSHIKATYPFRTTWGYTNAAFLTAGQIIPAATGQTWEDFIKERFFQPLGMTNTLALSKDLPGAPNKAAPYTRQDGKLVEIPYCQIDNLAPAGSISSSAADMGKWVMMLLNMGKSNGKQIVPEAAIRETRRPHSIIGNGGSLFNESHFQLYGLGFFLEEYDGKKVVAHTGGVNGFVSSVTMLPEEQLGVIVLTNTDDNGFYEALKQEIVDAYLGLPYRNYSDTVHKLYNRGVGEQEKQFKLWNDSADLHLPAPLPLSAYAGNYRNDVYGSMRVAMEQGELRMHFSHHPNMYARLYSMGGNRFYAVFSDPEFSKAVFPFKTDAGKVSSVTVKVADFIEYNPYLFTKID
jgi:CubicO group peptidase (beta-lactamase class C family)